MTQELMAIKLTFVSKEKSVPFKCLWLRRSHVMSILTPSLIAFWYQLWCQLMKWTW